MFHTITSYTKEYATKTADMSLTFRRNIGTLQPDLDTRLATKRFWTPQQPSKLTLETKTLSILFSQIIRYVAFFKIDKWTLPCCASIMPGYQTANNQNLDLANTKQKDLAGKPLPKALCIIYIYIIDRYHWFKAISLVPFKPKDWAVGALPKISNQGTHPSDAVPFRQPLPVNFAWHPWDEDFSTNVHLDMRRTTDQSICKWQKKNCTKQRKVNI